MIELFEQDINTENRQSSKGNQTKWLNGMVWYKADYTGYEGLAEYVVSALLKNTSLKETEIIHKNVLKFLQKEWYRNAVSLLNNLTARQKCKVFAFVEQYFYVYCMH